MIRMGITPAPRRSRAAMGAIVLGCTVLVGAATVAARTVPAALHKIAAGTPYPTADPDAAAERLQGYSRQAYTALELPEPTTVALNSLDSGPCYSHGFMQIDKTEPGVVSVRHSWGVARVPQVTADAALDRLEARLAARGWTRTSDDDRSGPGWSELGFRYEDPHGGDKLDAHWNSSGGGLYVDVYAPCATIPTGNPAHDDAPLTWTPHAPFLATSRRGS
ncbi:hypothetical protein [Streptomyces sp. TLI_146]|uniref:hypothetical protein n=1 Tax=Streptomyces sp. TLI_146 TaxID=1938858 RepID=UPI000CC05090|nr:hypothetical protein [Streptomyces sp. TLI_146]PKV89147.1 hypothetical protein BX283_6780 [Streptomyces sp. TLI_146]